MTQNSPIYLDYAAATPVDPIVMDVMKPWFTEKFGNPSSLHQQGQQARAAVDAARIKIAEFIDAQPTELYFSSSGTESCNWALLGIVEQHLLKGQQVHIIVSSIEHSAVLETAQFLETCYGVQVSYLPVSPDGFVRLEDLQQALREETLLVSVMMVNNEIGTLQPIEEIGKICREKSIFFHTDACQATGYYDLSVQKLQVDLMTLNAAKIYGPKGVGALYVREHVPLSSWSFGGGQEFKKRAGTENVPAIVGFGKAVDLIESYPDEAEKTLHLRNQLWERLQQHIDGIKLNGSLENRSPSNLNIYLPDVDGESLVRRLDLAGFAVSSGSACASGVVEPSHVLKALGYSDDRARSSIRVSLGRYTSLSDIQQFSDTLSQLLTPSS